MNRRRKRRSSILKTGYFIIAAVCVYAPLGQPHATPRLANYGVGTAMCENWLENLNTPLGNYYQSWIAGAITGYENGCVISKGKCIFDKVKDMSTVYTTAKAYCRVHPDRDLGAAALSTWLRLSGYSEEF